ncbi:hypothetical protein LIER_28805 [Lithospermum erythrorhizon]|uniref:Uncharacterized protein n=1 Tax=Lithospermum erythrorhizon TaxID=34254 RepID=A0AAV3RKP5_LITER
MTCTKKIGYMFSLFAKEHSNGGWSLVVKHGCHNHDFPTYAEGHPLGRLSKDEYEEVCEAKKSSMRLITYFQC